MICKTNVGGMTVKQAMIKGTADATISPASVLSGAVGYGANGQRVVGTLVPPAKTSVTGTVNGNLGAAEITWGAGFVPNYVMLTLTNKSGEFKTPAIVSMRGSDGTWEAIGQNHLYNYYDGSGGSSFGTIDTISDTGAKLTYLQSGGNYLWIAWK